MNAETGEIHNCTSCPFNEFGSDGDGKACKNMHRLYILPENSPLPYILTLPPTSIKNWKNYLGKRIVIKGLRPHHVITKITLKKEQSKGGITYSSAQFVIAGKVDDSVKAELNSYKESLKATTRKIGIINDDYDSDVAPANNTNVAPAAAENINTDDFVMDADPPVS